MPVEDLLASMRSGRPQSDDDISAFVRGVVDGSISRPQAAAWLAWAFQRTLTDRETLALTRSMTHSGAVLNWGEGPTLTDKHSTGGVGDKISLILAPLWAELGLRVPMISGRGLGHTGGTLDKLEAIPGFRTDLSEDELRGVLGEVGAFISGQTTELAPADRVLYGLRNETQTVESIPLIVGSILSKKLAEGVERLVLDVKTGSGAFMTTVEQSRALASALVGVAKGYGVECSAWITAMDRPLGRAVGNALEVEEAALVLQGGGPAEVRDLTVQLAEHPRAVEVLASGRAYERWIRMVEAQGGSWSAFERRAKVNKMVLEAQASGVVSSLDARAVGRAAFVLGAGRRRAEDPVDPLVGLQLHVGVGEQVVRGQPWVTIHHREQGLEFALQELQRSFVVGGTADPLPLVVERIG